MKPGTTPLRLDFAPSAAERLTANQTAPNLITDSCQDRRLSAGFSREWPQAIAVGDAVRSRRVPVDAG
jgi:hypothetical protein